MKTKKTKKTKPPSSAVYTVKDVAALLEISPRSVQRLCEYGEMPPGFLVGGSRRWNRDAIIQWITDDCKKK